MGARHFNFSTAICIYSPKEDCDKLQRFDSCTHQKEKAHGYETLEVLDSHTRLKKTEREYETLQRFDRKRPRRSGAT